VIRKGVSEEGSIRGDHGNIDVTGMTKDVERGRDIIDSHTPGEVGALAEDCGILNVTRMVTGCFIAGSYISDGKHEMK
jgi:hypothetical protein